MKYFVYIIYFTSHDKYYKGYTANLTFRLSQHFNGESRYTKHFLPWTLVYLEVYDTKKEALIRERGLKKYATSQILDLIQYAHLNNVHPDDFPII